MQFFERISLNFLRTIFLLFACSSALAQEDMSMKWLLQSQKIIEQSENAETPAWLNDREVSPQLKEDIRRLFGNSLNGIDISTVQTDKDGIPLVIQEKKAGKKNQTRPGQTPDQLDGLIARIKNQSSADGDIQTKLLDKDARKTYILCSFSMPEGELKSALMESSETDAIVVFRGVLDKESINQLMSRISKIATEMPKRPHVFLDPRPFRLMGQHVVVPTLVVQHGNELLYARGIIGSEWINKEFDEGKRGDLGKYGVTYKVLEIDLLSDIEKRIAKVDWEKIKNNAVQNYVNRLKFIELPTASQTVSREWDPSVIIQNDVIAPDGRLIARKGTKINPQIATPLTKMMIVFDGTDKKQLAFVKAEVARPSRKHGLILITNSFDRSQGLTGLGEIINSVGHNVYLLQDDVMKRFQLQKLPTTIIGKGNRLLFTEIGML